MANRVTLSDLATLLDDRQTGANWLVRAGLAAVVALQIAGPQGLWPGTDLLGPPWLYALLAVTTLLVAVLVLQATQRQRMRMEINALRLRGMRIAATAMATGSIPPPADE
jgi:hypothetical protein